MSFFLVALSLLAPASTYAQAIGRIYKCGDAYTNAPREGCVAIEGGTITVVPADTGAHSGVEQLRRAAESGDAEAQSALGFAYDMGRGVRQDHLEATNWYRLAAEQGNVEAQINLGNAYRSGLGVPTDHNEAIKWYRMAALQGHAGAQSTLGFLFQSGGVGKTKDLPEAAKWFRLAAVQGESRAQMLLGVAYAEGRGVIQDYGQAEKWLRLASLQGESLAQFYLGLVLSRPGPTLDRREAVKWFHAAAVQGNELAQDRLGGAYAFGFGVPQDFVRAHMWLNLSALSGNERTSKLRDSLAAQMTPQQIAEAQKLARECLARKFKNCD